MASRIHIRSSERGSVLVSVLAIIFVLLTIFAAVLTYALARYSRHVQNHNVLIARHLSNAGVQKCIHEISESGVAFGATSYDTPNGGSVTSSLVPWGPYVLAMSDGTMANQTVRTTALLGSIPPVEFDAAVTVCDEQIPFVVAGRTRIIGDVNAGPQGITTGRIRGEGPSRDNFHVGDTIIHSSLDVYMVDSVAFGRYLQDMAQRRIDCEVVLQGSYVIDADAIDLLSDNSGISIENNVRFADFAFEGDGGIVTIDVGGFAEFKGKNGISGLLEVACDGPILVSDSAVLDQVLLYSPDSIIISGDARFSGIAISESRIVVDQNARLEYPSCLMISKWSKGTIDKSEIIIRSRQPHETVCYVPVDTSRHGGNTLYLDTGVVLTGYLISQDKTDLRGAVLGSVMAERFHYKVPPSTYVNWVKDAYINRSGLDYDLLLPFSGSGGRTPVDIIRQDVYE